MEDLKDGEQIILGVGTLQERNACANLEAIASL
jgi:hypothetical protein